MVKGYTEFNGLDPRDGSEGIYRLPMELMDKLSRYAPEQKMLDLHCVKEIAESPRVAYEGLRTVDELFGDRRSFVQVPEPTGLCLAGVPSRRCLPHGWGSPPKGMTFAIFLDAELRVFDWDWIESDPDEPDAPIGSQERFERRIWPKD